MKKLIPLILLITSFSIYGQNPKILVDLQGNPPASFGYNFIFKIGSKIIYKATGTNGYPQIWVTDGTLAGTIQLTNFPVIVNDIIYDQYRNNFALLGNILYFTISGGGQVIKLWRTDGTVGGTYEYDLSSVLTGSIYLENRICANSNYLFLNVRVEPGAEPPLGAWRVYSISTAGQLQFVKKISNRQYFKSPDFYIFKDKMLTTGLTDPNADPTIGSPNQQAIYISDGTPAGTSIHASGIPSNAEYDNWKIVGDDYILTRALGWLVKIPGTAGSGIGLPESFYQLTGANRLLEPYIFGNLNYETGIITNNAKANIGSTFFFRGRSAEHGWELWKTDGTESGTQLVFDANPGTGNGFDDISGFVLGNKFLFYASASLPYKGLWATDATSFTTVQLNKAVVSFPNISRVDFYNGKAYFANQSGSAGCLWQTDGTSRGTVQINPDKYKPTPATLIVGFLSPANLLYVSTSDFTYKLMNFNTSYQTWYGDVSTNWNDPLNWEGNAIPTASDNVLIPGSTDNNPVVNATSSLNSLWVERNNVTVNAGVTLNVQGELEVFTALNGAGSINFNGSSNAKLGGDGTIPLSVIMSSGVVSLLNTVSIPSLDFQGVSKFVLNNYDLTITQSNGITGFANDRFIVTNGNGRLILPAIGTAASSTSAIFPVGSSASSYTPATVTNNGTSQQFSVRTSDGLYNSYNITYPEIPTTAAYTNSAVNKTWFINKQNNGQIVNAAVQLQWNSGDELPGLNRSAIQLAHYASGGWNTGTSGAASGSGPYSYSRTGLTSFSPFGIANANLSLPISLYSFTAAYEDKKVRLQWKTAMEQNSSHFTIERSANAVDFTPIARKEALGTSSITAFYDYTDLNPVSGTGYYRLKMYDRDNSYKLSGTVSAKAAMVKSIEVFPNPAEHNLQIQLSSEFKGRVVLRLSDITGRILHTRFLQKASNNIGTSMDITKLASGHYLLTVESGDGNKEIVTFVKR